MAFDGKAFGDEMVAVVRSFVEREATALRTDMERENAALRAENAALAARLAAVEARDVAADILPQIEAVARAVEALPGAPDLSGLITAEALEERLAVVAAETDAAIEAAKEPAPDLSGLATKAEVAEVRASIPEVPDLSGFATVASVEAVRAAIPAEADLTGFATKDEVAEVRAAIPAPPEPMDTSGFATKAEVAEAVAAIIIPEAIKGEDADPEVAAEIVMGRIEDRLAAVDERVTARLAEVKDGKDGLLPAVEPWVDRVHRRGEAVTHGGALWQATGDTGKEPPHADWRCLAFAGKDGLTPEFVGTYEDGGEFRRLDVVALNGGSFVALRDNPGPCPGDGWQLVASRGKPGQSVKGDKGDKGDKGEPGDDAAEVVGIYRSNDEVVVTFADGREMRA